MKQWLGSSYQSNYHDTSTIFLVHRGRERKREIIALKKKHEEIRKRITIKTKETHTMQLGEKNPLTATKETI